MEQCQKELIHNQKKNQSHQKSVFSVDTCIEDLKTKPISSIPEGRDRNKSWNRTEDWGQSLLRQGVSRGSATGAGEHQRLLQSSGTEH